VVLAGADYVNVGAQFPDGSVSNPSITFDQDTDTGLFRPGVNSVALGTGGSEALRVDSSQRLGIGVTSPESPLHVETTGETIVTIEGNNTSAGAGGVLVLKNNDTSANNLNQIQGADAGGQTCSAISFTNVDQANNEGELRFLTRPSGGAPAERFRFGSAGQLGIGGATYGTSGQFLQSQGSSAAPQWADAGGGLQSIQTFASSGSYTWTRPTGITRIKVYVTGGGGGGGGSPGDNANDRGGAGGGGGTAIEVIDVTAITSVTVTVGAGGSGGADDTDGGTGGTSSFGTYCSATGGVGGHGNTSSNFNSGLGGSGSGGNINLTGTAGGGWRVNSIGTGKGEPGGDSFWGGGGASANVSSFSMNGYNAQSGSHGGGGGGAYMGTSSGAAGGSGIVVVEEYA
jgi:hypothetical protein